MKSQHRIQSSTIPDAGKGDWNAIQHQSASSTIPRGSIRNEPESHTFNDSSHGTSVWDESRIRSTSNLITKNSNWELTQFSSFNNLSHSKTSPVPLVPQQQRALQVQQVLRAHPAQLQQ
ncbi:unnamed protein product [Rotaria sordida]|uniref:Uncharacterized protein n=1 Tax=Rotaria sordida TaxID=392033 RepID=A0A815HTQ6_9BILA|nr:unnamed protein product [Rotaria sordida]CAF3624295.1 unnamed protein product [Rotaria sordida]